MGTRPRGLRRVFAGAVCAAGATAVTAAVLRRTMPGGRERWERTNHRNETITLVEGPALTIGLATGSAALADPRLGAASALAAVGAGVFGLIDDLGETGSAKGLKGHLGALAHGELTTGGLKILGIGITGLGAAALASGRRPGCTVTAQLVDVTVSGALIAGTANLFNLFDLRPGRALKAGLVGAGCLACSSTASFDLAGVVVGASMAALPDDLEERTMAGDSGANAMGAVLGLATATALPRWGRVLALGTVIALTLASEKVSFTEVIGKTPVLKTIDAWGRRP